MKPLMSLYEIFTFKRLLKKIYKGQKIDILEWGSGGSTVYFTDFLRKKNIPYTWTSVEYNKGWHEKVSKEVSNDPDTKVVLFDVGNSVIRQRHTDMEDYIKYPKSTGQKFDLMFVDGRKRRRCLLESRDIVKNEGVVLLHDACRKYYQCSFREYPNNTFIGLNLWIGRINQVSFLRKILNRCQRFILETLFMYFIRPVRNFLAYLYVSYKLVKGFSVLSKIKIWYFMFLLSLKKRNLLIGSHIIKVGNTVFYSDKYDSQSVFRDYIRDNEIN